MKPNRWLSYTLVKAFALTALLSSAVMSQTACKVCGSWEGKIDFGKTLQTFRVRIEQGKSGELLGTLDLLSIGRTGLPLKAVTLTDSVRLMYEDKQGLATYTGKLQPDDAITGHFRQGASAGRFYLVREAPVDLAVNRLLAGSYQLGPDRYLDVGPFTQDGNRLGMFDSKTRRYHVLRATTDSEFFAGPATGLAYPKDVAVTFERSGDKVTGLRWRETGAKETHARRIAPYVEEEIEFTNDGVLMKGTLTKPRDGTKHPLVVMVPGSMTGPPRPGGYWPYLMVRHGVAMATFDKRGTGGSAGDWKKVGYDEQANDLLSLVRVLRARSDVDTAKIGLWGNSEGGWTAPLAASRSTDIKFLIIRSASALPVRDAVAREAELRLRDGTGLSDDDVRIALAFKQSIEGIALAPGDFNAVWPRIDSAYATARGKQWFNFLGELPRDHWWWEWWRKRGGYDPAPALTHIRIPTLVLLGENDCCMPPAHANAAAFADAFARAGNRDVDIRVLPKGSHGLVEVETPLMSSSARASRYVAGYLDGITEWLMAQHIASGTP